MARKKSRSTITVLAVLFVAGILTYAFWPRPIMVDIGKVETGSMVVTINEEGRTRVHDAYVVSSPVAGRLMRVEVEPGDIVVEGKTIVAQMRPTNPAALDIRTREQARAAVTAAEAALRVALADLNKAIADLELAKSNFKRSQQLAERGIVSQAALDKARSTAKSASATRDTAEAAIAMREAELANTRARLISFDSPELASAKINGDQEIPLYAPTDGHILRVIQQSETTLAAGTQIMEIGNIEHDLEIIVELLSTDAVQVSPGNRVVIDDWGGDNALSGIVERVDPWGFKKFSSLGVEEQRVNAIIRFTGDAKARNRLGHGYRIEAKIIVWETEKTLKVPSNALFREGENWAVFKVVDGRAIKTDVEVGKQNGTSAQILSGLNDQDAIILYPASGITDGTRVTQRTAK